MKYLSYSESLAICFNFVSYWLTTAFAVLPLSVAEAIGMISPTRHEKSKNQVQVVSVRASPVVSALASPVPTVLLSFCVSTPTVSFMTSVVASAIASAFAS